MTNRKSRWYKVVGGDFGAVRLASDKGSGLSWFGFDCLLCARDMFPEEFRTPRWQGPPSDAILNGIKTNHKFRCQGAEAHKRILKPA